MDYENELARHALDAEEQAAVREALAQDELDGLAVCACAGRVGWAEEREGLLKLRLRSAIL